MVFASSPAAARIPSLHSSAFMASAGMSLASGIWFDIWDRISRFMHCSRKALMESRNA